MKRLQLLSAILLGLLGACSPSPRDDAIYRELLANRPTEVPQRHMARLRKNQPSCDVFNEGQANQFMTCWWPSGRPVGGATLTYYRPNPLSPPDPSKLSVPGSVTIAAIQF